MSVNTLPSTRALGLRTPDEFLAAIPALLGFYPADSIVAVVVRRGHVEVTARWDLGVAPQRAGLRWLARRVRDAPVVPSRGLARVFLAGYGPPEQAEPALRAAVRRVGSLLIHAVVVVGERWWYVGDPSWMPHPVREDPRWARLVGEPECASRADVAALVAPPTGQREDDMVAALMAGLELVDKDSVVAGRYAADLIARWRAGGVLTDAEFLAAGVAMEENEARDEVWRSLTRDEARATLGFWTEVARRTPRSRRAIVMAVTGMYAWIAGHGALVNICLQEAEDAGKDLPLVKLLGGIADAGLPPSTWGQVRARWEAGQAAEAADGDAEGASPEPVLVGQGV